MPPNLYGYGATDKWTFQRPQTLVDQAELIRQFITSDGRKFSLVGHSFGGSVAMMAAKLFHDHIDKLILIEPNPFSLLRALGHDANYNEVMALYDCIKLNGDWEIAGAVFANYWNGAGTWEAMGTDRKAKFSRPLEPNFHEWDAVINEQTSINEWATFLPSDTTVLKCTERVQPINSIVELMRSATKNWRFIDCDEGGHMAPLTKPDLINPIIANALQSLE